MAEPYFFSDAALTVTDPDNSDETVAIAGLRGITLTPAYETTELYTADSTFRETVKQYEHNVNVEIDYAFFDIEAAQLWLGGQGTVPTDSNTDSTDTTDPKLFDLEVVTSSADGTVERTAAVEAIVFPEFPIVDGSQDEFEEYGLSGSGRTVTNLADTSA